MKRCPACRKVLPDDAMIFCPYDGSPLLDTLISTDALADTIGIKDSKEEALSTDNSSDTSQYDETLFYLSPEIIQTKVIDLLEKQKNFTVNRYIQNVHKLFYSHISEGQPIDADKLPEIKDNYLLPILDSLTSMGVVFIEYKQWELFSSLRKAFYLLCRRAEKAQSPLPIKKTWLWQEVIIRVYALGALLVDGEYWEQAEALIRQEVEWDAYYRESYWSRYFMIMISRAEELKEQGWILPTINYIESRSWLSDLFMSDREEITEALIGFDFLQCVYMLAYPSDANHGWPYPSFTMFSERQIEPIILKLITNDALRNTLSKIKNGELAAIINGVLMQAEKVPGSNIGWGDYWSDKRIKSFMDTYGSKG